MGGGAEKSKEKIRERKKPRGEEKRKDTRK